MQRVLACLTTSNLTRHHMYIDTDYFGISLGCAGHFADYSPACCWLTDCHSLKRPVRRRAVPDIPNVRRRAPRSPLPWFVHSDWWFAPAEFMEKHVSGQVPPIRVRVRYCYTCTMRNRQSIRISGQAVSSFRPGCQSVDWQQGRPCLAEAAAIENPSRAGQVAGSADSSQGWSVEWALTRRQRLRRPPSHSFQSSHHLLCRREPSDLQQFRH